MYFIDLSKFLEVQPSPLDVTAKHKWCCISCRSGDELVKQQQKITRVEVSDSEASQSFQPVEKPYTSNTASEATRDTYHVETEDLSADVLEVSATTSSELPSENTSIEENVRSREKRGT